MLFLPKIFGRFHQWSLLGLKLFMWKSFIYKIQLLKWKDRFSVSSWINLVNRFFMELIHVFKLVKFSYTKLFITFPYYTFNICGICSCKPSISNTDNLFLFIFLIRDFLILTTLSIMYYILILLSFIFQRSNFCLCCFTFYIFIF